MLMVSRLLRNRNFLLLWLAQIVSKLGDIFYNVGIMVTVFERTGSAVQTVGVMIASTLPSFLLGPVAGALVDRYPRKRVMIAMDLLRALLVALLLVLAIQDALSIWAVYLVVAGLAAAATFFEPARLAILPSLVDKEELVAANSLVMSTNQATNAIGYGLGGVLILAIGLPALITMDLGSFLFAALVAGLLAVPRRTADQRQGGRRVALHRSVIEGLRYLRYHPLARPLVTMEVLEHFPHAVWTSALMLVFTREVLNAGTQYWGYQNSIFFGGQLLGAAITAAVASKLARHPGLAIISNAFLFSGLTLSYALSPSVAFTLVLCFFFGPTSAMRDVAQDSLLQATVEPRVMDRIYATRNMLANLTFMLAGIGFAWLADQINVRWVYIVGGLMYFGTALYALSSAAIRGSQITQAVEGMPGVG